MQLDDWKKKLISFGCDGASANIAANGLKGQLEKDVPWILMFWCLYHRLELALKDALKANPTFLAVDEMLLRLYFLYEKSPKKCGELKDIVEAMASLLMKMSFPVVAATSLFVPVAHDLLRQSISHAPHG